MSSNPLIIIARCNRQAEAYAYSNGISEYICASNSNQLRGLDRGLEFVWVPEFLYAIEPRRYQDIMQTLADRDCKPVN